MSEPTRVSDSLPIGVEAKIAAALVERFGGPDSFDAEPYSLDDLRGFLSGQGYLSKRLAEWLLSEYDQRASEVAALISECQDRADENERVTAQLKICRARIRMLEAERERETIETAAREVC